MLIIKVNTSHSEVFKLNEALVVFVRSVIGFFTLLVFARILGKQQISQLTFFDYVLGITIGSIAATLSVDLSSRAWPHWIGLITWTGIVFILQWISLKSSYAAKYLAGQPTVVIKNGQIMEEAMKTIRYTVSDILEQLRDKGVFDLTQVQSAVLETNGQLSILLKPEFQQVINKDLNIATQITGLNTPLIYNGKVLEDNLKQAEVDRLWLDTQLKMQGINNPSEVFLANFNLQAGSLYIDKYKDSNSSN